MRRLIYLNSIVYNKSMVDGPGIRTVVFVQGCNLHCKGCHNKETWDISKGQTCEIDSVIADLVKNAKNKKVTISGGEPLMQKEAVYELIKGLKEKGFNVALYTGHVLEDVPKELVEVVDYLKTGPFKEELRTTTTPYVGSTNQEFRRIR